MKSTHCRRKYTGTRNKQIVTIEIKYYTCLYETEPSEAELMCVEPGGNKLPITKIYLFDPLEGSIMNVVSLLNKGLANIDTNKCYSGAYIYIYILFQMLNVILLIFFLMILRSRQQS